MAKWAWGQNFVNAIIGTLSGGPIGPDNPLPVQVQGGGVAQTVNQGAAGTAAWPVAPVAASGALTDHSSTITLGGTAQTVMAANAARQYLLFQNVSDTVMWVNIGTTAVANQPSFQLPPLASLVFEGNFIATGLVSVICATTGKAFTAKEA